MNNKDLSLASSGAGRFNLLLDITIQLQETQVVRPISQAVVPNTTATLSTSRTPTAPPVVPTPGPTSTPSMTFPTFVPTPPTMGGVLLTERGSVAFTGGKPNTGWTGLNTTAPSEPLTPLQMRPILDKNHMKQRRGMELKHGWKSDLSRLQDEHLEQNGMDTIAYLKNPRGPTQMNWIVTDHPQYMG